MQPKRSGHLAKHMESVYLTEQWPPNKGSAPVCITPFSTVACIQSSVLDNKASRIRILTDRYSFLLLLKFGHY